MEAIEKDEAEKALKKKRLTGMKRWKKVILCIAATLFIMAIGAASAFFVMRYRGKSSLDVETQHITYQGKEYRYRDNIVNVLCLGIDKTVPLNEIAEGRDNIGMSDTVLLVSLDIDNEEAKVIAIPRDTMVEVQTTMEDGSFLNKQNMQICYQYPFGRTVEQGSELTKECVSRLLYGIPIQRYCVINLEILPIINDAIGGVDVEIKEDLGEWEPRFVYGETVHLDGELARRFIEVRNKHRVDGSIMRSQRQKQYVRTFLEKAKSVVADDLSIPVTLFQELQKDGNMSTDVTLEDITYLVPEALKVSFSEDAIQVIPGKSMMGEDGIAQYHRDVDAIKELVINTFYEEI